jgi:hypothetical protein
MRLISFILNLFFLNNVFAQTNPVVKTPEVIMKATIADLEGLLSDTIEEGELDTEILAEGTSCMTRILNAREKKYRHFCTFAIKLTDSVTDEATICESTCEINFFSINLDPTTLERSESQVQNCLETLSSGCH